MAEKASDEATGAGPVGLDRILFFSDAVVAIAITLLALPLVDAALVHHGTHGQSAARFLTDNAFDLIAAAVSFYMIASSWRTQLRLFRDVTGYTEDIVTLQFIWIASIVALPIATALLVIGSSTDRLTLAVYLGTATVTAGLTRVQQELLRRRGLLRRRLVTRLDHAVDWLPVAARLVATVVALLFPQVGLWSLLALVPVTVFAIVTRRPAVRAG